MDRACSEQRAAARGDRREELVERLGARDLLAELGELLELAHLAASLLVQPGVLDRARDQRGARDEEVDLGLRELARRLGMERDDADRLPVLREHRNRDERLESLLAE